MPDKPENENRARFDRVAADWDTNPTRVSLARAVTDAICAAVPLRPDMAAMDFGAGTGLVTLGLLPHVAGITAVDTSCEMLRMLEKKLQAQQIANVQTLHCEIGALPVPEAGFDLVVSSMVLHHIPDIPPVLLRLRRCLRPGGWIALADLDAEDGTFHADPTGVHHSGFDRSRVCQWLKDAGFTNTAVREAYRIIRPSPDGKAREYSVFLSVGQAN